MARSKKSQPPPEPENLSSQDPVDPDPEETPEQDVAPKKRGRKRGVAVQVTARGDADEVREALGQMGPQRGEPEPEEPEPTEPREGELTEDQLVQLLSNPKNKVSVYRTFPKRWRGARCNIQLDQEGYRCPVNLDEIKQDVFQRFGGKSFMAYIHPNTMMGQNKILAAIPFENTETEEPLFEVPQDENQVVDPRLLPTPPDGGDPTMYGDPDPMAGVEQSLKTQMRVKSRQLQLAQLQAQLEEFQGKKKEVLEENAEATGRSNVEARIALIQLENSLNRQIDAIQSSIAKLTAEPPPAPPMPVVQPNGGSSDIVKILLSQNAAAENRFNELMRQQTQLMLKMGSGGGGDIDAQLDRLIKLKSAMGDGGEGRVKRLEGTLIDMALERLTDGGGREGGDGESDIRFAVKQLTPVIKNFVDKKLSEPDAPTPSKEQFAEMVKLESARIVQGLVKQGFIVKPQQAIAGPQHPQKIGAPAEKKPAPAEPEAPAPAQEAPKEKEEDTRMNLPPDPSSPAYNRKKAVDFVLDSILADIKNGFPEDSYVVGDALDLLDDEILDGLLKVSTGEDLEKVVGPHCTPEKMQAIKDAGVNPRVKTWLTRVITTLQDEYRKDVEEAQKPEVAK